MISQPMGKIGAHTPTAEGVKEEDNVVKCTRLFSFIVGIEKEL